MMPATGFFSVPVEDSIAEQSVALDRAGMTEKRQ
jgi:hypothetical protein